MTICGPVPRTHHARVKLHLVAALRRLSGTGMIRFHRYTRATDPPTFELSNVAGETRVATSREVPAYLVGGHDLLTALRQDLPDIIDTAFADPKVVDRESLGEALLGELETRYGEAMDEAVGQLAQLYQGDELVRAS